MLAIFTNFAGFSLKENQLAVISHISADLGQPQAAGEPHSVPEVDQNALLVFSSGLGTA